METITSIQNPKVKHLLQLQQKSSERRKAGLFVVEGRRELLHCLEAGFEIDSVFVCPQVLAEYGELPLLPQGVRCFEVSTAVYEKLAYRGGTEGVVAEVKTRTLTLNDLLLPESTEKTESKENLERPEYPERPEFPKKPKSPLVVVLESVEKPGNLGAILRSADASGVDAVIVCDPLTDLYNPNLIRSSVGAAFSVPCVACTSAECIAFLKQKGIQILTAQLQDSHLYYDIDMRRPTAIVMGTESTGLTDQWRQAADAHIRIPMLGQIDSLNVSVSAAIFMFEAVRQRQ